MKAIKEHLVQARERQLDLEWFRWYDHLIAKLRKNTDCGRFASRFEHLADRLDEQIARTFESSDRRIPDEELSTLLLLIAETEKKTAMRMKRVKREARLGSLDLQRAEPSLRMGHPEWSRHLGILAYYPGIWAWVSRSLGLDCVTWGLSVFGAALALLYIVDTWVIVEAKPVWIFDDRVAGPVAAQLAEKDQLWLLVAISIIPLGIQSFLLAQSLWFLLVTMGAGSLSILLSILVVFYTWVLHRYAQWRRGPFLACPWCGKEFRNPDPMRQHCRAVHSMTPEEYMSGRKDLTEDNMHDFLIRGMFIMGTWELGVELIFFLRYGDILRLFAMLALDVCLMVFSTVSQQWIESKGKQKKKRINTELQDWIRDRAWRVLRYSGFFTVFYMIFLILVFQGELTLLVLLLTPAFAFMVAIKAHSTSERSDARYAGFWQENVTLTRTALFAILGGAMNVGVGVIVWSVSQSPLWTIVVGLVPSHFAEYLWLLSLVSKCTLDSATHT